MFFSLPLPLLFCFLLTLQYVLSGNKLRQAAELCTGTWIGQLQPVERQLTASTTPANVPFGSERPKKVVPSALKGS